MRVLHTTDIGLGARWREFSEPLTLEDAEASLSPPLGTPKLQKALQVNVVVEVLEVEQQRGRALT